MAGNRSIVIRIDGAPKPQPRVKAYVRGKHAGVYTPGTAAAWTECVTIEAKQHRPVQMIEGPVRLDIIIIIKRPKAHESSKGGLKKSAPPYFNINGRGVYGGDWDNYGKLICDALTECAFWKDDGQVWGSCRKRWADLDEAQGALVVVTPVEDKEPGGWLSELDRKMRRKASDEPPPKTQQVIPQAPPVENTVAKERRAFCDLFVAAWMAKYMRRYDFQGAKDAKCAQRIWDACGHDLDFAKHLIGAYMADDEDFAAQHAHSLQLLSAGGVLPRYIAMAQKATKAPVRKEPMTTLEMIQLGIIQ